jgi:hypothetical protein
MVVQVNTRWEDTVAPGRISIAVENAPATAAVR